MLIPFHDLVRKYDIKLNDVLHIGANEGQEAEEYRRLGAHRVFWVEAIPEVHRKLLGHLRQFHNQRGLLACVSDTTGERVTFNIASNQGQSSSMLEFGTHATEHPNVSFTGKIELETITVEDLLRKNEIELKFGTFLNIDLQGAELLAMKGMSSLMKLVDYCYIEVNEKELYQGCPLVGEIDEWLLAHDFEGKESKITNWGWGDKFYKRKSL